MYLSEMSIDRWPPADELSRPLEVLDAASPSGGLQGISEGVWGKYQPVFQTQQVGNRKTVYGHMFMMFNMYIPVYQNSRCSFSVCAFCDRICASEKSVSLCIPVLSVLFPYWQLLCGLLIQNPLAELSITDVKSWRHAAKKTRSVRDNRADQRSHNQISPFLFLKLLLKRKQVTPQ